MIRLIDIIQLITILALIIFSLFIYNKLKVNESEISELRSSVKLLIKDQVLYQHEESEKLKHLAELVDIRLDAVLKDYSMESINLLVNECIDKNTESNGGK